MFFKSLHDFLLSTPQEPIRFLTKYTFELYSLGPEKWHIPATKILSSRSPRFDVHQRLELLHAENYLSQDGVDSDLPLLFASSLPDFFSPVYLKDSAIHIARFFDENRIFYTDHNGVVKSAQTHPSFLEYKSYFENCDSRVVLSIDT